MGKIITVRVDNKHVRIDFQKYKNIMEFTQKLDPITGELVPDVDRIKELITGIKKPEAFDPYAEPIVEDY